MTDEPSPPWILVAIGLTIAVLAVPTTALTDQGQIAIATMVFVGVLWVSGGLPLPVTALCVPVLLSGLGAVSSMTVALRAFADPIIFLLLAGFVLAEALQKHGIDRRIAYRLIALFGNSPRRLILAVMVATAGLSMVVSNSATTAMMVPIALGISREVAATRTGGRAETDTPNIEVALLLGTAYAASIGGLGTVIGSPPNAIVVAQLESQIGFEIGFLGWMAIGIPVVLVGLPVVWWLLAVHLYPPEPMATGGKRHAQRALDRIGPLDGAGRRTLAITGLVAGLWILGGLGFLFEGLVPNHVHAILFGGTFGAPRWTHQGVLYFVLVGVAAIPVLVGTRCVSWDDVQGIDWGTLILLGGGLALADGLTVTDATEWLAAVTIEPLVGYPVLAVVLAIVIVTVAFSELASNTATIAIFAPVLIAVGPAFADALGTTPEIGAVFFAVTGAIAASFGFALPVATPPNAIAFGTGDIDRSDMLRAGLRLDVLMIVVATALMFGLHGVLDALPP